MRAQEETQSDMSSARLVQSPTCSPFTKCSQTQTKPLGQRHFHRLDNVKATAAMRNVVVKYKGKLMRGKGSLNMQL